MSINDVLEGKPSQMTKEEIQQTMMKLQEGFRNKQKEMGEKDKVKGLAFLEENKKKEGVTVTKSGLQYKALASGKGPSPKLGDTVSAHYRGTLIDGTEFDSSYKRGQPSEFPVDGVIEGWKEALQLMKVGDKFQPGFLRVPG